MLENRMKTDHTTFDTTVSPKRTCAASVNAWDFFVKVADVVLNECERAGEYEGCKDK